MAVFLNINNMHIHSSRWIHATLLTVFASAVLFTTVADAQQPSAGPEPSRQIQVDRNIGEDRNIEKRVRAIFDQIEALRSVGVHVESGVATLSGEVIDTGRRRKGRRTGWAG